ncbi:unnamed protein product, partial [Prorocentrum cordatum]
VSKTAALQQYRQSQERLETMIKSNNTIDDVGAHEEMMKLFTSEGLKAILGMKGITPGDLSPPQNAFNDNEFVAVPGSQMAIDLAEKDPKVLKMQAEEQMWEHVKSLGFVFKTNAKGGNAIASRWQRVVDKEGSKENVEYKALKGNSIEQEAYRASWAREKYQEFVKRREKVTTFSRTEYKNGQYLAIGRVAHLEGGGRLGWLQAIKIFCKTMAMGPPWIAYDELSESLRTLYIIRGTKEAFTEAWTKHEVWSNEPELTGEESQKRTAGAAAMPELEAKRRKTEQEEAAAAEDATLKYPTEDDETIAPKAAEEASTAKEAAAAAKKAKKVVTKYTLSMSNAHTIKASIVEGDQQWAWAKDDTDAAALLKAMDTMKEKLSQDHQLSSALTRDLPMVRRMIKDELVFAKTLESVESLEPLIETISQHVRSLLQVHETKNKKISS